HKLRGGFLRRRERPLQLGQRRSREVLLPLLEPIDRPEQGQESVLGAHVQAHLVDRVDLVDLVVRMLFPDAGKEGGRQQTAVRKAAAQLVDEDGDAPLTRSFFDEPNDRLEVLAEADLVRWCFGSKGSQAAQARHIPCQAHRHRANGPSEKSPSCGAHGVVLSGAHGAGPSWRPAWISYDPARRSPGRYNLPLSSLFTDQRRNSSRTAGCAVEGS